MLEQQFIKYKQKNSVKQCPKCNTDIEKNGGCNHMTCTRCKHQFCWLCNEEYIPGHFGRVGGCQQFGPVRGFNRRNRNPCLACFLIIFSLIFFLIALFPFFIFGPPIANFMNQGRYNRYSGCKQTLYRIYLFFEGFILNPFLWWIIGVMLLLHYTAEDEETYSDSLKRLWNYFRAT